MFGKNKKVPMSYRDLKKKYNSLELEYELLVEKTSSELYKTIIDGDLNIKYENNCLIEQNKDLRKTIKELKAEIKELNTVYKK